jgi:glucose/arabinose dehydrogenase/mono/diheme cytochrome c family protein
MGAAAIHSKKRGSNPSNCDRVSKTSLVALFPGPGILGRTIAAYFSAHTGTGVKARCIAALGSIALLLATGSSFAAVQKRSAPVSAKSCADDDTGITLPSGFCATVYADNIGHARHLVVASDGVVYVNTWSGTYYGNDKPHAGGFLVALKDTSGDGRANLNVRFGTSIESGNAGGTGIALYKGALYAETNDRIVRYALPAGAITPTTAPQVILSGMPLTGDHPMHPFQIDVHGQLYVDMGSATNSCQIENRTLNSRGIKLCTELQTRAGTWRYDANRIGQSFSPAERFATGLRNGEGIAFDLSGRIFATMHGRDQLSQNWPSLYKPAQGVEEPAEELVQLEHGADYGWPYCYYSLSQRKLVLAPEYGGDGGKATGLCARKKAPIAAFPGHWAPNDLVMYEGRQFPAAYRGGVFIAFHGSWNRAPFPQDGYSVVFQPFVNGKPSGHYVIFANGFAGAVKDPGLAAHRPSGLAVGPDGALYISDDQHGRIWRVTYRGPESAAIAEAPVPITRNSSSIPNAAPPEGIHPDAGSVAAGALPKPPGVNSAVILLGSRVFHGEVANAPCAGCHGINATGTPLGPDLTSGKWRWGDGSVASIARTIKSGVPIPKDYRSPMPAMGGVQLTPAQVSAVATYVWALGHPNGSSHNAH